MNDTYFSYIYGRILLDASSRIIFHVIFFDNDADVVNHVL
jgi:hypothetical protein